MKYADKVLNAMRGAGDITIKEISQAINVHHSTVGRCLEFLKINHRIAERNEGLKKIFRHFDIQIPTSTLPKGDKASPWGHLGGKQ